MDEPGTDRTDVGREPPGWQLHRSRSAEWVLLTGNRLAVATALLAVVALTIWAAVTTGFAPMHAETPILFMLFALISGNFVLITIVVSLNQFVLSRHLESPDEIRRRMEDVLEYRREVGEATHQDVLPITPAGFLMVLLDNIAALGRELDRRSGETTDEYVQDLLWELSREIRTHTALVTNLLEGAGQDIPAALFATLNADYASYLYVVYHLKAHDAEELDTETAALLTQLIRSFEQVDVARRFFKTIFIQTELAALSRRLLYLGLPVQLVTVLLMLAFTTPVGQTAAPVVRTVVVPAVFVAGFAPTVLLTAYILRFSVVAERTAAMYPFTADSGGFAATLEDRRWTDE